MTEKLRKNQTGFKIWKNPEQSAESPRYLGEIYPPVGSFCFSGADLRDLGLGPGTYTVLAPEEFPHSDFFDRWQSVVVPTC